MNLILSCSILLPLRPTNPLPKSLVRQCLRHQIPRSFCERSSKMSYPNSPSSNTPTHPPPLDDTARYDTHDTIPKCTDDVYKTPTPPLIDHHTPGRHYTTPITITTTLQLLALSLSFMEIHWRDDRAIIMYCSILLDLGMEQTTPSCRRREGFTKGRDGWEVEPA